VSPILGVFASAQQGAFIGDYESIATLTASGGESFLSFTSIPSTYSSIQLRGIGRFSTAVHANFVSIKLNNDTAANYVWHRIWSDGGTAFAGATTASTFMPIGRATGSSAASSIYGAAVCDILDYSSTNKNKTIRALGGTASTNSTNQNIIQFSSGLWLNTAAVNRVDVYPDSGTWSTGTTFALYGIKG